MDKTVQLDNPFDYEDALWKQFRKVGVWKISSDAIKQSWNSGWFFIFGVCVCITVAAGTYPLFVEITPWIFGGCIISYLIFAGITIRLWDQVLIATFPLAGKTVLPYVNRHSTERRFLRFFLWHQFCLEENIKPSDDMLKRVVAIVKAQHEVLEVKWGLADLIKKAGVSAAIWLLLLFPFSVFVRDRDTHEKLDIIGDALRSLPHDNVFLFLFGSLVIGLLIFWSLAVLPTAVTRQRKEFALFLTWWSEGLANRSEK